MCIILVRHRCSCSCNNTYNAYTWTLLFLNFRMFHMYKCLHIWIWNLDVNSETCISIHLWRDLQISSHCGTHLIHFCRGRAYVNGNVDHNVVKPRGTTRVRIIKSNVSFTCAAVQEIKDYFAYFKCRAVFLMQSKYLLERKLTELREPNLYLQA